MPKPMMKVMVKPEDGIPPWMVKIAMKIRTMNMMVKTLIAHCVYEYGYDDGGNDDGIAGLLVPPRGKFAPANSCERVKPLRHVTAARHRRGGRGRSVACHPTEGLGITTVIPLP